MEPSQPVLTAAEMRAARRKMDLSQAKLWELLGHPGTIGGARALRRYEKGERNTPHTLAILVAYMAEYGPALAESLLGRLTSSTAPAALQPAPEPEPVVPARPKLTIKTPINDADALTLSRTFKEKERLRRMKLRRGI